MRAGEVVATIREVNASFRLIAALPGHYRPLVQEGMTMRFSVTGHRKASERVTISHIGETVLEAASMRDRLARGGADKAAPSEGSGQFMVEARMPEGSFLSGSERLDFYDGMEGIVDVRVRGERALFVFLPGLKRPVTTVWLALKAVVRNDE